VGLPRKVSGTGSKHLSNLFSFTVSTVFLILPTSSSTSIPLAGTYLNLPFALLTTHQPPTFLPDALRNLQAVLRSQTHHHLQGCHRIQTCFCMTSLKLI
jgi:hypothetical protein